MGKIFTKPYEAWYRLDKRFIHRCRDVQCAWQRATKGYCYRDLWGIDSWLSEMLPKAFREFALNTHGYPSNMTDTEWNDILLNIAECFEKSCIFDNEYFTSGRYDIDDDKMIMNKDKALDLLKKYWYDLWD